MLAAVARGDGTVAGFGVVHLLLDALALPGVGDALLQLGFRNVEGSFAAVGGVEANVVVVVVEHQGDVELFANRQEVVDGPAYIVVFENEAVLAGLREAGVILLEALQRGGFVAELAAHVNDHYCVAVLLLGQLEEGEQLVVVFEVSNGGINDFFAGRAELGELENWLGNARQKGSNAKSLPVLGEWSAGDQAQLLPFLLQQAPRMRKAPVCIHALDDWQTGTSRS